MVRPDSIRGGYTVIPKDIFKKIQKIHIRTNHIVNDIFAGEYESAFRGRGMEFEEVREYNIAVNCIAPSGGIDTEGNRHLFPDPSIWEKWEPRDHFALAVAWLAQQTADSFTGQLVYSRPLIAKYGLCTKWCCAALGREPCICGPLSVDWQSNLSCRFPTEEDEFR